MGKRGDDPFNPITCKVRHTKKRSKLGTEPANSLIAIPWEVTASRPSLMLSQGCFRALFWRTIYFHLSVFKMGFGQWAEMGPKVGQKWVFGCKSGSKCAKTLFFTHLKPISADSRKPTSYPV